MCGIADGCGSQLKRREFIALLGGAAAALPLAARAQSAAKPMVGYLSPGVTGQNAHLLRQSLAEAGYVEGRNLTIEYRFAEGQYERLPALAAELVQRQAAVIIAVTTPAALAARAATATIPIVFNTPDDPVGVGLVDSLARPGGNATGLSIQNTETVGKRVELLREVAPDLRRLAIMGNVGTPATVLEIEEVQSTAAMLGLEFTKLEIRRAADILPTFEALKGRADVLYVCGDPLVNANRVRINTLALGARLPTMYGFRDAVEAGGLMSYGPNYSDLFRRAADFVDKILRGAKPADLPVEQPTKFDLIINLTTAKVLGLKIPESFLLRADEVIE